MKHQASPQVGISGIYAGEDVKKTLRGWVPTLAALLLCGCFQ